MSFPDLRAFIDRLRDNGDLVTVEAPVDRHLEVAEIHRRVIAAGGPALLFTHVSGSTRLRPKPYQVFVLRSRLPVMASSVKPS